jgi:hypothetical protein
MTQIPKKQKPQKTKTSTNIKSKSQAAEHRIKRDEKFRDIERHKEEDRAWRKRRDERERKNKVDDQILEIYGDDMSKGKHSS